MALVVASFLALSGPPIVFAPAAAQAQQMATSTVITQATSTPEVKVDAVACNCYLYVKTKFPSFPITSKLKPNTVPSSGVVAIFDYDGLPHYGIIREFDGEGFWLEDSNYRRCRYMKHYVRWDDPAITGFWSP